MVVTILFIETVSGVVWFYCNFRPDVVLCIRTLLQQCTFLAMCGIRSIRIFFLISSKELEGNVLLILLNINSISFWRHINQLQKIIINTEIEGRCMNNEHFFCDCLWFKKKMFRFWISISLFFCVLCCVGHLDKSNRRVPLRCRNGLLFHNSWRLLLPMATTANRPPDKHEDAEVSWMSRRTRKRKRRKRMLHLF